MQQYVTQFKAKGQTNLNGVLKQSIESLKHIMNDNTPSTLLIFTHGKHEINDNSVNIPIDDIINLITETKHNQNFTMYSMGLGTSYNRTFFEQMAREGEITHIDLRSTNDIVELEQYMQDCAYKRDLLVFVRDITNTTQKYLVKIPHNSDIHIADPIPLGSSMYYNNEEYTIGCVGKEATHTEDGY
ncbi:MAG: hypothetical protein RCG15_02375 [Candidatus Rickettsia vulgarisii]